MVSPVSQPAKPLSTAKLLLYFGVSILINGLGNGLTVTMNLGSAVWTASAVNLSHALHLSLLAVLLGEGVAVVAFNALVLRRLEWRRIAGNFLFMIPFSFLVSGFAKLFALTPITHWALPVRIVLDLLGICCIGVAISIYQRINVVLHPNDDFMQILRFHFFKGNAVVAQWASYLPPLVLIVVTVALTHQVYALNVGTLFALLCQGAVVALADRHVFRDLTHRHLTV